MKSRIALLRGINVGGRHSLAMKELVGLLEELGCENVKTYIQSGNVVFRSRHRSGAALAKQISAAIAGSHGFEPAVFVLDADELRRAAAANPYPEAAGDPKTLHIWFVMAEPGGGALARVEGMRSKTERVALVGNALYLHAPDGIGRSKLAGSMERALGVDATARNWRTITKLLAMVEEPG